MDNGSAGGREMKAAMDGVNKRANPWWPLITFVGFIVLSIWVGLIGLLKTIKALFKQKKSVKGKLVLITGAGRGLGRNVAFMLSKQGAHIACVDINTANNDETAKMIREQGGTAQSFTCNIAKSESIEQLQKQVKTKMGSVDILVNNAALLMAMNIEDQTYKDIRAMFEVNLMGHAFMTKAFLEDMMERNSGHIVTISSVAALSSVPFLSLYSSTKSGLTRFFETVRVELEIKKKNIPVTVIHPFFINTSADYASWFDTYLPILEENYVGKSIVDAILYEKDSITVPSALSFMRITDALIGSYQYNCLTHMVGSHIHLPTKNDRETLPYAQIVNDTTKTS